MGTPASPARSNGAAVHKVAVSAVLLLVVACGPGSPGAPEVTPARTLGPDLEEASSSELFVVTATPQERAELKSPLTIVFNKPMRPLTLAEDMPVPAVSVEPAASGSWQWDGTSAVTMASSGGVLKAATRYRVTVPQGVRAADGTSLKEPYVFEFETPRPSLKSIEPTGRPDALAPGDWFKLQYDQPLAAEALKAAIILEAGTRRIGVEVQPDPEVSYGFQLRPLEALPLASFIRLRIGAELVGLSGPLPSGREEVRAFRTYGPLTASLDCALPAECGQNPSLRFSNPVRWDAVRRALKISPGARKGATPDYGGETKVVRLSPVFQPKALYSVSLAADLRDVFGQPLGKKFEARFRLAADPPGAAIGAEDGFLEPVQGRFVAVGSSGMPALELTTVKLSPADLASFFAPETQESVEQQIAFLRALPHARRHRLPVAASLDTFNVQRFALSRGLEGEQAGSLALIAEGPGVTSPELRVVHPTDLAFTSKLSPRGGLVWVASLSAGRPLPGAIVELSGLGSTRQAVADGSGIARFSAEDLQDFRKADHRALLVARLGNDWAYERVDAALESPPYDYSTELDYEPRVLGSVFVDRGIYRPDEPVYVKGWLRAENDRGTVPLAGRDVRVSLRYRAQSIAEKVIKSNEFGGFSTRFSVPRHASLGEYSVLAEGEALRSETSFKVGEYRSAEFFAEMNTSQREAVRGEEVNFEVSGEYLFGAKMAGAKAEFRPYFAETSFHPPGTEGFSTDAWEQLDAPLKGATQSLPVATLDAQGRHKARFGARYDGSGPATIRLYAGVKDVTEQQAGASASVLVHPGTFYLGLKAPEQRTLARRAFLPRVIAAEPDGKRRAGVPVTLELYRRRGNESASSAGSEKARPLSSCKLTTAMEATSCALTAADSGHYYVLAKAKDERDNPLVAADWLWVSGAKARAFRHRPVSDDETDLELTLDKDSYAPGDVAHALVRVPWKNAEVLLTLEGRGIYWHEQKRLPDGTGEFTIPVDERIATNATLALHAVRRRTKPVRRGHAEDDEGRPTLLTTSAEVRIDQELKRLRVEVLPALSEADPGEKVKVRLRVRDHAGNGRRAELAVYAVDEGVLMLTGYATPDVLGDFTPDRPNMFGFADTRYRLGRLYDLVASYGVGYGRLGGSHKTSSANVRLGDSRMPARKSFATTPYFEPHVVTNAQGEAEVTVPLSDSLTRFRVMAVATTPDDRYGSGEASITTSSKLMARPALPRFARVGDRFQAAVALTSKGFEPGNVRVKIAAQGLTVHGPSEKVVKLGRDASVDAAFAVSAQVAGKARVRFEIQAGDRRDAVEHELPVTLPIVPQAVAAYGKTERVAGERLGDLRGMRRDYGGLEVSVSSTALVGLDNGFDQLIEYPYGCTEQLSSRLMPLLPLRDLAKDFGIALPAKVDDEVQATIGKIMERQLSDGGFGLWPGANSSNPWLTTYVFRTLDEAKKRGAPVPRAVLDHAHHYLVTFSKEAAKDKLAGVTRAYVAYVLAEYGRPDHALLSELYGRERDLPLFGRAFLLHAFALTKAGDAAFLATRRQALDKLSKLLTSNVHLDGNRALVQTESEDYEQLFDSAARSTALVLRALLAANPKHPLGERLARGLLSQRRQGTWRSTQETSFALLALDAYRQAQEAKVPNFQAMIWLGQQKLGQSSHRGRSLSVQSLNVAASRLDPSRDILAIEKVGSGTLFYEALLRYAPKELPKTDLDRGFSVQHVLSRLPQGQGNEREFVAGEAVVGEVTVLTPSRRSFVVIDVPLPAGFEAVDHELRTSSRVVDAPGGSSPWSHRELRDDRVVYFADSLAPGMVRYRYLMRATTRGSFIVPPVRVEEMYAPEVFGRTAARQVEIR